MTWVFLIVFNGLFGILWGFNSLIAILRNQETVEAEDTFSQEKSEARPCGPEATATLHTTHRPGAQSDVFELGLKIEDTDVPWYTMI